MDPRQNKYVLAMPKRMCFATWQAPSNIFATACENTQCLHCQPYNAFLFHVPQQFQLCQRVTMQKRSTIALPTMQCHLTKRPRRFQLCRRVTKGLQNHPSVAKALNVCVAMQCLLMHYYSTSAPSQTNRFINHIINL